MRVVSLLPSATEIVCALGFRERLVGRSHECDFPSGVEVLPALTAPKVNPGAGTEAIDRDVRRQVEQGLSVYRIDTAVLEHLQPDLVLTQDQCEVCAVSLGDVTAAVCGVVRHPVNVVSLSPLSLGAVFESVLTVARALGAEERGRDLVGRMKGRLAVTAAAVAAGPPRPRVVHVEWIAPLMVGGHWIHELVEAAGGEHLLGVRDGINRPVVWEEVRAYDPEVVVIAPCGFKIAQGERDLSLLERLPGWSQTAAARAGRVFLADGNAFFNRPGPRLVDTAEIVQAATFGRQAHHRFPPEALKVVPSPRPGSARRPGPPRAGRRS